MGALNDCRWRSPDERRRSLNAPPGPAPAVFPHPPCHGGRALKRKREKNAAGTIAVAAFVIACIAGWVMNIIALVRMNWEAALNIEGILRVIGIVVAPLGVVMGWFV